MKAFFDIKGKNLEVDFSKGQDISIPLDFNGEQPNTYGVKKASSEPYRDNQFIGDTREGGSCNFETHIFTPHCNGTHTECIGHITKARVDILSSLNEEVFLSTLISITPKKTDEHYIPSLNPSDLLITKKDLEQHLIDANPLFLKGLIIRTLPNYDSKKNRDYMKYPSAFFSIEAIKYIVSLGIDHLLVDTPSVDRLFDDGKLSAHNLFWETKGKEINMQSTNKTITEMVYVPTCLEDGTYLVNLQIPPFISDAAPSRPILYKINDL